MKNTSLQAVSIGSNVARLSVPLPFSDQPLVLADANMAKLFREVGSDRGLFAGAADWPVLEDLLAAHSRTQFKRLGPEEWAARGGRHRPDGGFTCDLHSAMTTDVVNRAVREHAGLYWRDADTERLRAIRFLPRRGADAPLLGLSLVSGESEGKSWGRARMASAARRLRLTRRAEQAYWTLFGLVRQQRRSQVLLPDVLLRQIIWGATGWPRDWRAEAVTVLRGLTAVRAELLRLRAVGWQPNFGSSSALVDHLEDMSVTDPQADRRCDPLCPLHGQGRHHHFRVGIGQGFLGVLERHCTGSDGAARVYDFFNSGGQDKPRRDAQVLVHLPTAVSAPAKWSGLSQEEVGVIRGVVGELTRGKAGRKGSGTPPLLLHGNRVPNLAAKALITCPHLNPGEEYTVFGGNGVRAGAGYKIVGDNGGGWVAKCGFELPEDVDPGALCRVVRRFLKVLSRVGPKFDLTVAGLQSTPHGLAWHTVAEMNTLAAGRAGVERLLGVHLRVYGPPDALDRLSGFFADRGGFAVGSTTMAIPNSARNCGGVTIQLHPCGASSTIWMSVFTTLPGRIRAIQGNLSGEQSPGFSRTGRFRLSTFFFRISL